MDTPSNEVQLPLDASFLALRGNTFGILESDGTTEEKIMRLLNLLPMAFNVMNEARDTISRLRDENDDIRARIDSQLETVLESGQLKLPQVPEPKPDTR